MEDKIRRENCWNITKIIANYVIMVFNLLKLDSFLTKAKNPFSRYN